MKSIERRFRTLAEHYPTHSSYICFLRTVKDQDLTERFIRKWFLRLVDPADYSSADKKVLLQQLIAEPQKVVARKCIEDGVQKAESATLTQTSLKSFASLSGEVLAQNMHSSGHFEADYTVAGVRHE